MTNSDIWTSKDKLDRSVGDDQSPSEERKSRIRDAARQMFLRTGFDKGGLREIASAAGLTKSAIYLDFSSKEALLDDLIRHDSLLFAERLFAAIEEADAPASFGTMFVHAIKFLSDAPFVRALLIGDTVLLGSYVARNRSRFLQVRSALNRALLEAMRSRALLHATVSVDAAETVLMMLAIGYVETPADHLQGNEELLLEMGRMLDRWLLREGAEAAPFEQGELTTILRDAMSGGSIEGEGDA